VCIAGRHNDPANCDDEVDDDLPSIDELLAFSSKGISTGYQDSEDTLQHPEGPLPDTSGSRLGPTQSGLEDGAGDGQGTQGMCAGSPSPRINSKAAS
jgi:hypothetical protein